MARDFTRWPEMKLVLLDRDGVINHDSVEYVKRPEEFVPIEGSIEAIARLHRAGFRVAVCTNQAGVARGYFDLGDLAAIHRKLADLLAVQGAKLVGLYHCPHGPADGCCCRKPHPGMLLAAMRDHGRAGEDTVFIGDSARDLEAAEAAGCLPILVRTGNGARLADAGEHRAAMVFRNLAEAADWLLSE
jgi:D-glycero-D-manno-heptose 1,7-bisphosphate phosphatase